LPGGFGADPGMEEKSIREKKNPQISVKGGKCHVSGRERRNESVLKKKEISQRNEKLSYISKRGSGFPRGGERKKMTIPKLPKGKEKVKKERKQLLAREKRITVYPLIQKEGRIQKGARTSWR